jgi:hypothetical protein
MKLGNMDALRDVLNRLGWPIEHLTDDEVLLHVHRRWFGLRPDHDPSETRYTLASAMGIVSTFAREGNLDALCWSDDAPPGETPSLLNDSFDCFDPSRPARRVPRERRRSPRRRAKDFVIWSRADDDEAELTGWLVCQAEMGLAFIAPMGEAPVPGCAIAVRIHKRNGDTMSFGRAQVVRQEYLSEKFVLVCVELVREARPQGL